jgi:hypothetical protein
MTFMQGRGDRKRIAGLRDHGLELSLVADWGRKQIHIDVMFIWRFNASL